jgi:hypothetical protein
MLGQVIGCSLGPSMIQLHSLNWGRVSKSDGEDFVGHCLMGGGDPKSDGEDIMGRD